MAHSAVGIRLDMETRERLITLARARKRSPHYLMKEAIEIYLAAEEALETERQLTLARWERFELTGETVGHETIRAGAASLPGAGDDTSVE